MASRQTLIKIFSSVVIFLLSFLHTATSFAQCDEFTDPNCEDPDLDIPLDQWVIVLVIVVGLLGLKKTKDQNNPLSKTFNG